MYYTINTKIKGLLKNNDLINKNIFSKKYFLKIYLNS